MSETARGRHLRQRRSLHSRSTRAFGVLAYVGLFIAGQAELGTIDPRDGIPGTLVGLLAFAVMTWFIWRCGGSPGVYLGESTVRVEQVFHSWVLSPDRVLRASCPRGLELMTPSRTISVFGLSGSLVADLSGNTSVHRAARAVEEWAAITAVVDGGGVERSSCRQVLVELAGSCVLWLGTALVVHGVLWLWPG